MAKKILLVEDDVSICTMLKTLLELESFEVLTSNGALQDIPGLLQSFQPDFVIVDYHLKNATALDVLKLYDLVLLRHRPFTLVTSGEDQRERCRKAGADGFLLKPFMPGEMINWLHEREPLIDRRKD
jgi:DNA-binding response OmpR family regulator